MIHTFALVAVLSIARADDWWTTGAPEPYQCALQFVPQDLLSHASAYTKLFLASLTAESPDYWGAYYGGSQYDSRCHPSTTIDSSTPITMEQTITSDDITTTLTATQQVTYTVEASVSSLESDGQTVESILATTYPTKIGTPLAVTPDSNSGSLVFFTRTPVPDIPRTTSVEDKSLSNDESLVFFTRTPIPDIPSITVETNYIPSYTPQGSGEGSSSSEQVATYDTLRYPTTMTIADGTIVPLSSATTVSIISSSSYSPGIGTNPFGSDPEGVNPFGTANEEKREAPTETNKEPSTWVIITI